MAFYGGNIPPLMQAGPGGAQFGAGPRPFAEVTKILRRPVPLGLAGHESFHQRSYPQTSSSAGGGAGPGTMQFPLGLGDSSHLQQNDGTTQGAGPLRFGATSKMNPEIVDASNLNQNKGAPQINPGLLASQLNLPPQLGQEQMLFGQRFDQRRFGGPPEPPGMSRSQRKKFARQQRQAERAANRSAIFLANSVVGTGNGRQNQQQHMHMQQSGLPFGSHATAGNGGVPVMPHYQDGMLAGVWVDESHNGYTEPTYDGYYGQHIYDPSYSYPMGYSEPHLQSYDDGCNYYPRPHVNPKFIPPEKTATQNFRNPYPSATDSEVNKEDHYDPNFPTISRTATSAAVTSQRDSTPGITTASLFMHGNQKPTETSLSSSQKPQHAPLPLAVVRASHREDIDFRKEPAVSASITTNNTSNAPHSAGKKKTIMTTGVITQIQPGGVGMISGEIFFQDGVVDGDKPAIGDKVVVEAEAVTGLPFKYHAKRVTKLDMDLASQGATEPDSTPFRNESHRECASSAPLTTTTSAHINSSDVDDRRMANYFATATSNVPAVTATISSQPESSTSNFARGKPSPPFTRREQLSSHVDDRNRNRNPSPPRRVYSPPSQLKTRKDPTPAIAFTRREASPPFTRRNFSPLSYRRDAYPAESEVSQPRDFGKTYPPSHELPTRYESRCAPEQFLRGDDSSSSARSKDLSSPGNKGDAISWITRWELPSTATPDKTPPRQNSPRVTRVLPRSPEWNSSQNYKDSRDDWDHTPQRSSSRYHKRSRSPSPPRSNHSKPSSARRSRWCQSRSPSPHREDSRHEHSSSRHRLKKSRSRSRDRVLEFTRAPIEQASPLSHGHPQSSLPKDGGPSENYDEWDDQQNSSFGMFSQVTPPSGGTDVWEDDINKGTSEKKISDTVREDENDPRYENAAERMEEEIHQEQFLAKESRLKDLRDSEGLQELYNLEDQRRRRLEERHLSRIRLAEIQLGKDKKFGELQCLREQWGPPTLRFEQERMLREIRLKEEMVDVQQNIPEERVASNWYDKRLPEPFSDEINSRGLEGLVKRRRTPSPQDRNKSLFPESSHQHERNSNKAWRGRGGRSQGGFSNRRY